MESRFAVHGISSATASLSTFGRTQPSHIEGISSPDLVVGYFRFSGEGGEVGAGEVGFAQRAGSTIRADASGLWEHVINISVELAGEAGENAVEAGRHPARE